MANITKKTNKKFAFANIQIFIILILIITSFSIIKIYAAATTSSNNSENITAIGYKKGNWQNTIIRIPCHKFEGYPECSSSTIEVSSTDSNTGEYLGTNNGGSNQYTYYAASSDGTKMSWGLANKLCADLGMKLPNASELHSMYVAQKKGAGEPFAAYNYWASSGWQHENMHNCYMGEGNCGDHDTDDLQYVRCMK